MDNNIYNKFHKDDYKKVQNKDGPFYFLKWIFKVEFIILAVVLLIFIFPNKIKFIAKYSIGKHFTNIKRENESISDIENAIDNNKFLSEDDKFFLNTVLINEIEENKQYINIKKCAKRIGNLRVIRENKKYKTDNALNIAGSYIKLFNQIHIYENSKEILLHELNHLISDNSFESTFRINVLSESVNEHFTQEYINNSEIIGYENYIFYSYVMTELLSEEIIKEYKFTDNESIIIQALLEIDDNIDEAYNLISSIKINGSGADFHNSYEFFYKKKYSKEIKDDIILLLYFYNSNVQTNEERGVIRKKLNLSGDDDITKVIPKGYFSKNYKSEHEKCVIEYVKNGKKETLSI